MEKIYDKLLFSVIALNLKKRKLQEKMEVIRKKSLTPEQSYLIGQRYKLSDSLITILLIVSAFYHLLYRHTAGISGLV